MYAPFIYKVRDALPAALPGWDISPKVVQAAECMLAQASQCVLLIGVKKRIAVFVPKPILQSWSDAGTLLESVLNLIFQPSTVHNLIVVCGPS